MNRTILIVEDSSTTRSLITSTLEELENLEFVEASSGFEALKVLPKRRFDLIITDINMPDINGLELINFVRSHPTHRDTPLIIVTTEKSTEDRERGLALGADTYITKPFLPEELQEAVKNLLNKNKTEDHG